MLDYRAAFVLFTLVLASSLSAGGEQGIQIVPGEDGAFEYSDDFSTPKVLVDAFLDKSGLEAWSPGQLTSAGPLNRRYIIYRFYGSNPIKTVSVSVEQMSNARNLGGVTHLEVSKNGVDWDEADSSTRLEPDANAWQTGVLVVPEGNRADFAGRGEFWLRLTLENYSGLKTNPSNVVKKLAVRIEVDPHAALQTAGAESAEQAWGDLRANTAWQSVSLDWRDPAASRAPHYYEDVDGWLVDAAQHPALDPGETEGFPIWKGYSPDKRPATGLAVFLELDAGPGPVMARILVRTSQQGFRRLAVYWDGEKAATCDAASYFETEKPFLVTLRPGPGTHELRVTGEDTGLTVVRRIELAGVPVRGWAPKPKLPEGGPLEVLSAYYLPDPLPPADSQVVEGRKRPDMTGVSPGTALTFQYMQCMYTEHEEFGALRMVVRNAGQQTVRLGQMPLLNGTPVDQHYVDFVKSPWDAPGVVWYRVRPRTLAPGECAQAYVRFRKRLPGDSVRITLPAENAAAIEADIAYTEPEALVDYVVTSQDRKTLYIYARKQAGDQTSSLRAVSLDGGILENAAIYGADFPGDVALAVAGLAQPLKLGAYHVAGLHLVNGRTCAAQFRVLPFLFPRSSVHVPAEMCGRLHMNLATWWMRSLEECRKHSILTSAMLNDVFGVHERVAYVLGPDEPDARDDAGDGYDKGLGWNARKLADSGWQELLERYDAPVPSWLNIDGTVRPLNWAVYGQFGDINGFDPYPVTYYGADHAYVRESLEHVRRCAAPTPVFAFLEAYGWASGQGVPDKARGPVPDEYRQNLVQAIGAGAKGLSSWVYSAGAGGWARNDAFANEIGHCNRLIEHIEDLIILGTPINLAANDAGTVATGTAGEELWEKPRVWSGCLLCGPDALLVAAVNHIPAAAPGNPEIEPARNVTVSLTLPEYLPRVAAAEVTEDGFTPVSCEIRGNTALLRIEEIVAGNLYLLRRASS
ncbi:MAG TPA: hypothetical protein PKY01_09345 [Candidatus Hydrogenedentes bacterium]|nr:hypothetical protein [Candidatus Hydrogenedentota bacterium]